MRITDKHLEAKVAIINRYLGHDEVSWDTVGAVSLYGAYGSTAVHRVMSTSGGVESLSALTTKREVSMFLDGMIAGLRVEVSA